MKIDKDTLRRLENLRNEMRMRASLRDMTGTIAGRYSDALTSIIGGEEPSELKQFEGKYPLVLFFEDENDADEFIAVVKMAKPEWGDGKLLIKHGDAKREK